MRIVCVLTASELAAYDAELIVLPEGVWQEEIEQVQLLYPNAMTVGGMIEHGSSYGVLWVLKMVTIISGSLGDWGHPINVASLKHGDDHIR